MDNRAPRRGSLALLLPAWLPVSTQEWRHSRVVVIVRAFCKTFPSDTPPDNRSKNRVLRSGWRSHRRTAHVGRTQRDLCVPPIRLWRREMRVLMPKSTQKQYTRARRWPRAAQNWLTEAQSVFGRTPGAGASARPNGGVQTAHAAPLRIAFSWSSAIYAFLPVVADGPSRARCDDEPPACAGLAMAVLAAPWVRPGEGRFSSLLRPRFKSHRDQPKHPPRPGRPRGVPCGVSRARPRKLRAPAGVGSGSSQRAQNGKRNKNNKRAPGPRR